MSNVNPFDKFRIDAEQNRSIKGQMSKVLIWVKKNRLEAVLLALVLFVGAYFRLYRISEYMTFLGDEGRDVIIVRKLLVDLDPILVGPRTSIGDMYLGPLYYYMMAPALLFAGLNPAGPAIMVALLGVTTIFFVWWVTREWFPMGNIKGVSLHIGALVAAALYAVSPTVINFSKSSWNPNIMPFFALLTIYSVWKWWSSSAEVFDPEGSDRRASEGQARNNSRWLIVTGISLAFVLQSHYLGLLLFPVIAFFGLLSIVKIIGKRQEVKVLVKRSFIGLSLFVLLMSPLVIFDARHGWRNFASINKFFTQRQTTVSARPWTAFPKLPEVVNQTTTSLLGAKSEDLTWFYVNISIIFIIWVFYETIFTKKKIKLKDKKWWLYLWGKFNSKPLAPFILLIVWLLVAYIGMGVYKQHIYDHYFGFFFPAPFLIVGGIAQYFYSKYSFWWKLALLTFFVYAMYINLVNSPIKNPPNRQAQRTQEVAEKIRKEAGGETFNLAVIAERNYEDAYQYFFGKRQNRSS